MSLGGKSRRGGSCPIGVESLGRLGRVDVVEVGLTKRVSPGVGEV